MSLIDDERLAALMADAQAGDQDAYRQVLHVCVPVIAATVRHTGVVSHRVDDVIQEVLLSIHRALPTYDPARRLLPWVKAIAIRRAIDSLRLNGRRAAREVQDDHGYLAHPDAAPDALASFADGDRALRLRQAVAKLPPLQRQAVEKLGFQERTLDDVAAETGRSKGALKVNLHRALRSLRTRLERDAGG